MRVYVFQHFTCESDCSNSNFKISVFVVSRYDFIWLVFFMDHEAHEWSQVGVVLFI